MLQGISPLLSPELLFVLHSMGHGDEIVLADANFPGVTMNTTCLRADGVQIAPLLHALLPLFPLDTFVEAPVHMMQAVQGDSADPAIEQRYRQAIDEYYNDCPPIAFIERFDFYDRAKQAYAVVVTGELVKYGNIILKKGVIGV